MGNEQGLKQKTINGIIWKGLERLSSQMVSLIVSIVLARLLFPEDYSVISIANIFFSFCNIFISEGINSALIQKKNADELDYSTVLILNMAVAVVFYVIMFFVAPFIAKVYERAEVVPVIRVMALTFFIHGYKAVLSAKLTSEMKFKKYFGATIAGISVSAVVGIVLALKGFGVWSLVAQRMTNEVIDSLVLTFVSKVRFKLIFSGSRFKQLFGYGGKIFFASSINMLYVQSKPLIIGIKFSTNDIAYYNKGESFPSLMNAVASSTLTTAIFPAMAKSQDDKSAVKNITHRYISVMSYLIFPIMLGFFAIAESFVLVVLTEKWKPIIPYIQVFCVVYMLELIQIGNLNAIKAVGRSDLILKMEFVKKAFYTVVIVLCVFLAKDPIVLAISTILCHIIATIINTYPNRKLIGYGYLSLIKDLLPNFLIAIPMCLTVYFMNYIKINLLVLMLLQIIVGAVIYLGLSFATKNANFRYIINTIKDRKNKRAKNEQVKADN